MASNRSETCQCGTAAILSSATFLTATVAFSVPAAATTTNPAAKKPAALAVAPADEYFGPLAMSILGIRNALKDSAAKLDADAKADCDATAKHVELIEVSVHAWETKYPKDSWLPRTVLALEHVYARIHTDEGRQRATQTAAWLSKRYAKSKEAVALHDELAQAAAAPAPAEAR